MRKRSRFFQDLIRTRSACKVSAAWRARRGADGHPKMKTPLVAKFEQKAPSEHPASSATFRIVASANSFSGSRGFDLPSAGLLLTAPPARFRDHENLRFRL